MKIDPDHMSEDEVNATWQRIQHQARENRRQYARQRAQSAEARPISHDPAKPKNKPATQRHKSRRSKQAWFYNPANRD